VNPLSLLSEPQGSSFQTQTHINPLTMGSTARQSSGRPHSKSTPHDSMLIKKEETLNPLLAQSSSPFDGSASAMPWPNAPQDPIDLIVNAMSSSADFSADRPFFLNRRLVKSDVPSLHQPEKVCLLSFYLLSFFILLFEFQFLLFLFIFIFFLFLSCLFQELFSFSVVC
jgi:hypothetical protein